MRRLMFIVLTILLVVAAVNGLVLSGLRGTSAEAQGQAGGPGFGAQANSQTKLQAAVIDTGDLKLTVSATGHLTARVQSNLGFDQPGQVVEILVEEGQTVQAGQLLARQEDSAQQAALAQADFNLKAADAALQKILKPVDAGDIAKAEANVKAAQASYSSIAGGVSQQDLKTAQLQVDKANAALVDSDYLRAGAGGQYSTTDPNYQKSVASVGQAWADAQIAQLNMQKLERGHSLLSATANIAYGQAILAQLKAGPKQSDINMVQASYVAAKLQRDQAQHALDKTKLVAPYAGVISAINIKQGEVSAGPVMKITDTKGLYVEVNVDETDIGKIQSGQTVTLTLDALSGVNLTGKVQRIAQTADTNSSVVTYVVRVLLDPTTAPIKAGMTANAMFLAREVHGVVRIPNQYLKINHVTKQTTVNLVGANDTLSEIPITLGQQGNDFSEVIEGLNVGETVALVLDVSATSNGQ
jgi:HlyD family secretion protein